MAGYKVYRAGQEEAVRELAAPPRHPRPLRRAERAEAPVDGGSRRGLVLRLAAALAAAGLIAALLWLAGGDVWDNLLAALDLARLSEQVPPWLMVALPVAAVALLTAAIVYLAFGHHAVLKWFLLAVVVAALAAPGFAVGYTNGIVSDVGGGTEAEIAVVEEATEKLAGPPLPGKAMNVLLIGSDKQDEGDPGRSDTQILVRLDPETKSISMLSVPRDLLVEIPGYGSGKMNEAYSYGGPALVLETFTELTGLEVHHFVEVDFAGFWHVVNILGGVYVPVDRRYYNPESSSFKSIDIEPGYQLLRGHDALDYVRFRHDQQGDFTRMQRQQLFLRELQRQSTRWSHDWDKVLRMIRATTKETRSDLDSLSRLQPLVQLAFAVDTDKVSTVHLEGSTPMIDGISYVESSPAEIAQAVQEFRNPTQAPVKASGPKVGKKMFRITVHNTTQTGGLATSVASQLELQGYVAAVGADAPESNGDATILYATRSLQGQAKQLATMLWPATVRVVDRTPGGRGGVSVFLGNDFDGGVELLTEPEEPVQTVTEDTWYGLDSWRELDAKTPIHLHMPTAWSPGLGYDEFRAYSIPTTTGKRSAAAIAVGTTPSGGYFGIQVMRWSKPPAIQDPSAKKRIDGTVYRLFYEGGHLHMVSWRAGNALYWVMNTLDNELSADLMLALATSFEPVK